MQPITDGKGGREKIFSDHDPYHTRLRSCEATPKSGWRATVHLRSCFLVRQEQSDWVTRIHTENANELLLMSAKLKNMGISLTKKYAHTLESSDVAGRMNKTFLENVRTLLKESEMPNVYWGEAMNYPVHFYNRTISKVIGKRTPHKMLFRETPQNDKIRIFRCKPFPHFQNTNRNSKLCHQAEIEVFFGF